MADAQAQAQVQAQPSPAQLQAKANRDFLDFGLINQILCNAQNGTAFAQNTTSNWLVPTINGYAHKITVRHDLTVNYTAAGSGPYANMTAAGMYAIVNRLQVSLGNLAHDIHPYFSHLFQQMKGYAKNDQSKPIFGERSVISNMFFKTPSLNAGNNSWTVEYDVDFNHMGNTVFGILPMGSTGTPINIQLNTGNFVGKDPLNNVVDTNGTITVTGSTTVVAHYRDGRSLSSLTNYKPSLAGLPTIQTIKPSELSPLTAGTNQQKRIGNPYKFLMLASVVIDGQQSSSFVSDETNLTFFSLEKSDNESDYFFRYNSSNDGLKSYFRKTRQRYGRDFDAGVLIAVHSQVENVTDPSNYTGQQVLSVDKFPASRLGFNVGAVSSTNTTPRVVSYGVIVNETPLAIV